jgi:hypothetical protein
MTERRPRRTVKLPPPTEVPADVVVAFLEDIGWDAESQRRVRSVRINHHRIEVDVAPRPDIKLTVRHPVVFPDE